MCFRALAFARINAFFWRHSRGTLALSELPPSGGRDALPRDPRRPSKEGAKRGKVETNGAARERVPRISQHRLTK
jgi:hypothetical protein